MGGKRTLGSGTRGTAVQDLPGPRIHQQKQLIGRKRVKRATAAMQACLDLNYDGGCVQPAFAGGVDEIVRQATFE
jgi:hypothetical protein